MKISNRLGSPRGCVAFCLAMTLIGLAVSGCESRSQWQQREKAAEELQQAKAQEALDKVLEQDRQQRDNRAAMCYLLRTAGMNDEATTELDRAVVRLTAGKGYDFPDNNEKGALPLRLLGILCRQRGAEVSDGSTRIETSTEKRYYQVYADNGCLTITDRSGSNRGLSIANSSVDEFRPDLHSLLALLRKLQVHHKAARQAILNHLSAQATLSSFSRYDLQVGKLQVTYRPPNNETMTISGWYDEERSNDETLTLITERRNLAEAYSSDQIREIDLDRIVTLDLRSASGIDDKPK